ncbi:MULTISPECIES: hypothetical protein [Lactobacillus]|uniref:hypothetical protein n=1 Tax=Lactobacillus TaxID=1578 RepID=UPI001F2591BF|nr:MULTISPECIES: hypothetical protein [Lactobacillus]
MKKVILPRKRWQQIFDLQLIIAVLVAAIQTFTDNSDRITNLIQLVMLILIVGLNFYVQIKHDQPDSSNFELARWINLALFSEFFCSIWLEIGNFLLLNFRSLEVLWVILLWIAYLVLLLPLAVLYAGNLRHWYLALFAVILLDQQYGPDESLMVSKHFRLLHSVTAQGVIAAFALLFIACCLSYAWFNRFNPSLKFVKSPISKNQF